jgi:hypothetical protein
MVDLVVVILRGIDLLGQKKRIVSDTLRCHALRD